MVGDGQLGDVLDVALWRVRVGGVVSPLVEAHIGVMLLALAPCDSDLSTSELSGRAGELMAKKCMALWVVPVLNFRDSTPVEPGIRGPDKTDGVSSK